MGEVVKTIAEMLAEPMETEVAEKKDEVVIEKPAESNPAPSDIPEEKEPDVKDPEVKEQEDVVQPEPKDEEIQPEPKDEEIQPEPKVDEPVVVEKKLYAGKFEKPEDLEKAYGELQSAFTKKSQNVSEKIKETESMLDEREFQNKMASVIEDKALSLIEKTYATITDDESRKQAAEMLMGYKSTGDVRYIDNFYNFLDPTVDRQLQKNLTALSLSVKQDFASRRNEIMYEPVKKELAEIEAEDPEFLKENQEILVQVIRNNPKTSVRETRELIKQVEARAVEKYKKTLTVAPKVEKSPIIPVQKASAPKPEDAPKKPWEKMTVKEMLLNE